MKSKKQKSDLPKSHPKNKGLSDKKLIAKYETGEIIKFESVLKKTIAKKPSKPFRVAAKKK